MKEKASLAVLIFLFISYQAQAIDDLEISESFVSELESNVYKPLIVLTPTRIGQSIQDTPGTVSVLTGKQLMNRGITSIPEALRLVPGMSVLKTTGFSQESGHDYQISYHGGSARLPRRLQVQVDGMSVYLGGLSKIDWAQFPVTVHDIERIEVTRNPSSATYGANSFSAVINVITRHSRDVHSNEIFIETGSRDDHFGLYRLSGGAGESTISFRASTHQDDGYDFGIRSIPGTDMFEGHRDSMGVDRLALRLDATIDPRTRVTATLGRVTGDYQTEFVVLGQEQDYYPDIAIHDWYLNTSLSYSHSELSETRLKAYTKRSKLSQDFRACSPLVFVVPEAYDLVVSNKKYFDTILAGQTPSGGSHQDDLLAITLLRRLNALGPQAFETVCGTLNQDYTDTRHHFTIEHHRFVGEDIRLVGGTTYERLENNSETFFNGKASQDLFGIFFNTEWEPTEKVTYNAGFYVESSDTVDRTNFNPRLSINWHASNVATLRLVGSEAYRTPDLAETERDWNYVVRDIKPVIDGIDNSVFARHASSDEFDLKAERIRALELGLLIESSRLPYMIDIRLFYEKLSNLISERPAFSVFNLSNDGEGSVQGMEVAFSSKLGHGLSVDLSYSYQDHDFKSNLEEGLNAQHQGQAAIIYESSGRTITFSYVGNSSMSHRSFGQWAITWLEKIKMGKAYVNIRAHGQYQPNTVGYAEDDLGIVESYKYDQNIYGKLSAEISF